MFNPSLLPPEFLSLPSTTAPNSTIPTPALSQAQSLQSLIVNAVRANDVDLHPTLLQNIIVVGGTTLIPGFLDRLQYELSRIPGIGNARPRIESPGNIVARKYSAWLGGSILASLGTFHQLWIGREEYMEVGKSVVHRRAR
jgi:actin-related protein